MRCRPVLLLLLAVLLAAGCARTPDREQLQGTWVPPEGLPGITLRFEGDNVTVQTPAGEIPDGIRRPTRFESEELKGTFRVDQSREPKELDLTFLEEGREKVHHGIYKLDGNKLTLCTNDQPGGPRPTAFAAAKGVSLMLLVKLEP
jgi:uncharacterized protein (TIGR03067 family)